MTRRMLALVFLSVSLALAGCSMIGGVPVGEVAELLEEGGEKRLRDPLRPIRGTERVLLIALDGVGDDDFHRAIREGRMPHVADLLGSETKRAGVFANAYAVPGGIVTVLPTATTAAWAALFTGQPPAETGIAGDEWFVRDSMRFYAPVPVSVAERTHAVEQYTDNLLGKLLTVPTVYEQLGLRAHVGFSPVYTGADLLTMPDLAQFGDFFETVVAGMLGSGIHNRKVYRETDESSVQSLLESMDDSGVPDLQTVYFPGVDLLTHIAEHPEQAQQEYLAKTIDPLIGRVLQFYREAGVLDSTFVVFVADHGHTPVLADDRHALETVGDDEPAALLQQVGFRVRPFKLSPDGKDYQAVFAYQGGMAFLYLADRGTCPGPDERCEWSRPPRWEEDVLPVLWALHAANESGAGVPALRGTLDLILARPPGAPEAAFQVWDGERLVPVPEYLREHPQPDLLRLDERLRGLAVGTHGRNAGDVLLLARSGIARSIEDRFSFSRLRDHSQHGGAGAQDSRVPLLVVRTGVTGDQLRTQVRAAVGDSPTVLDVASLLRALLNVP